MNSSVARQSRALLPYLKRRFEILGILGQGSFGTVYRVRDLLRDGQECALKVAILNKSDSDIVSMFREEFRILASLEHPNVARVFDFGPISLETANSIYFTSEYVSGKSLFEAAENAELPAIVKILR